MTIPTPQGRLIRLEPTVQPSDAPHQHIEFFTTSDGARIAYNIAGQGPALAATLPQPASDRNGAERTDAPIRKDGRRPDLAILKTETAEMESSSDSCRAVSAPSNAAIWSAKVFALETSTIARRSWCEGCAD